MWIINLWKDNGTGYNPPILLFIKNNTPEIARNPLLTEIKNRFLFWRSGRDSNPRVVSHKLISSPVPKRLLWKRAGQSWSVCPRIFGGVKPFSSGQNPKNGDSTNQIGNARFGEIWHTFLEKCKISCKIIEGRYSG